MNHKTEYSSSSLATVLLSSFNYHGQLQSENIKWKILETIHKFYIVHYSQ